MSYRKTYFRISTNGYEPGWSSECAMEQFHDECRDLFQAAGWAVHPGHNGGSDIALKGNQDLYLHPQNFSGVILDSEVKPVRDLLAKAKTFQCYHVDFYEEYLDINDEEYWALLESKRMVISATILECCKTKRSSIYLVGPVALNIAERFSVKRVCDKGNRHNIAYRFVCDIVDQLIEEGLLVTAITSHGDGIRAATDKEKKALGFLPQQPDTLGNVTIQGW